MENIIINKVEQSGLITIDLGDYYPKGDRVLFDIHPLLWEGFVLKEKDFRDWVKNHDWSSYKDKYVAFYNSSDAIVPSWAYMLLTASIREYAKHFIFGSLETLETVIFNNSLHLNLKPSEFKGKRLLIKGCGDLPIPNSAYVEASNILIPVVKSLMFGEACSSVPVYKQKPN